MTGGRFIALAALGAVCTAAAACGSSDPTRTQGSDAPAEPIAAASLEGGDAAKGQKVFAQSCAECHGVDASGITAPDVRGISPKRFAQVVNTPPAPMEARATVLREHHQDLYAWLATRDGK